MLDILLARLHVRTAKDPGDTKRNETMPASIAFDLAGKTVHYIE